MTSEPVAPGPAPAVAADALRLSAPAGGAQLALFDAQPPATAIAVTAAQGAPVVVEDAEPGLFDGAEVISSYSRAQALDDGMLIDVSTVAREAGIKFPVALTAAVWAEYVKVPAGVTCQDEAGRLWDILWMMRSSIRLAAGGAVLVYELLVRNDNGAPKKVTLKALCGPGDNAAPVITICMPLED